MYRIERAPTKNFIFARGPPANNFLFSGGPPENNFLFAGVLFHFIIYHMARAYSTLDVLVFSSPSSTFFMTDEVRHRARYLR